MSETHAEAEEVDDQSVTVTHEWYLAVSKISIIMACKYVAEIWSRLTVCVIVQRGMTEFKYSETSVSIVSQVTAQKIINAGRWHSVPGRHEMCQKCNKQTTTNENYIFYT